MKAIGLIFTLLLAISSNLHAEGAKPFKKLTNEEPLRKIMVEHSQLKDPFSVQFRKVYVRDVSVGTKDAQTKHVYCGEINAKNSFGGYIGWSRFLVEDVTGEPSLTIGDSEINLMMVNLFCKDAPN